MITLQEIKQSINQMPQEASIDDVIERLIYLRQLDEAMDEVNKGNGIPNEDIKKNLCSMVEKVIWSPQARDD